MNMKIKNINSLREDAILTLEKLEKKEIDITEAGIRAKLYETIISSAKSQMMYAGMLNKQPKIEFMGECLGKTIEGKISKKLIT
jgi:hypothetical protein